MTFEQTKAALARALRTIKLVLFVIGIITQALYLSYLAYAIYAGFGNLAINIMLGIVCATYLIFYAVTENIKATKRVRHVTKRLFKFFKFVTRMFTITMMVYSIYNVAIEVDRTILYIVLTVLMCIACTVLIFFEIFAFFVERRLRQLAQHVSSNLKTLVDTARRMKLFNKLGGKKKDMIEPTATPRSNDKINK